MKIFGQKCEPIPADELPDLLLKAKEAPTISGTYMTREVSTEDIKGGEGEPIVMPLLSWIYHDDNGKWYDGKTHKEIILEEGVEIKWMI